MQILRVWKAEDKGGGHELFCPSSLYTSKRCWDKVMTPNIPPLCDFSVHPCCTKVMGVRGQMWSFTLGWTVRCIHWAPSTFSVVVHHRPLLCRNVQQRDINPLWLSFLCIPVLIRLMRPKTWEFPLNILTVYSSGIFQKIYNRSTQAMNEGFHHRLTTWTASAANFFL